MSIPSGKLPAEMLERMIGRYASSDSRVIVGPAIGEDATAIDMGGRYLIAKTDPITFVADDIGTYAININANDIATMGGRPLWFLATILLPEGSTTPELVERIFQQLSSACERLGVSLCGGHTEITPGLDRPLLIGTMLGEVEKDLLIRTGGARVGDDIILTKGIAIEGTSILAREKAEELEERFGRDLVQKCRGFIEHPGISVLRDAQIAMDNGEVHCMHDPTEGGLATGLYEIARAADVGLIIDEDRIPVLEECRILCEHYGIDPLGLIASGALLITVRREDTDRVIEALETGGISASRIGEVVSREHGIRLRRGGRVVDLPLFERDEIVRVF
jgi:hydrogenase maturation factor